MKLPNLSEWALRHQQFVGFLIAVAVVMGAMSYLNLGRKEDPEFAVKSMLISVGWPGASAQEVAEQVVKPIEQALTTNIPDIDYIRSKARPGQATLNITLLPTTPAGSIPDLWYTVRKTVADHRGDLPDDVVGPQFNDEFGTTFGNIYAVTGDGFAYPTLRRYAEELRDRVMRQPDVGKVDLLGEQDEAVYVTYDSARLAMLGSGDAALVVRPAGLVDVAHAGGPTRAGADGRGVVEQHPDHRRAGGRVLLDPLQSRPVVAHDRDDRQRDAHAASCVSAGRSARARAPCRRGRAPRRSGSPSSCPRPGSRAARRSPPQRSRPSRRCRRRPGRRTAASARPGRCPAAPGG